MTFGEIGLWLAQVGPAAAIGFGLSQFSKDRAETNLRNYAILEPHYEELKNAMTRGYSGFVEFKNYLEAQIASTNSLDPMLSELLEHQIRNAPQELSMLDYEVSKFLPRRCQSLADEWLSAQDGSIDLMMEISNHYATHTRFLDDFEEQKKHLFEKEMEILHKIKAVKDFIEKDKLKMTKSTRRRGLISW